MISVLPKKMSIERLITTAYNLMNKSLFVKKQARPAAKSNRADINGRSDSKENFFCLAVVTEISEANPNPIITRETIFIGSLKTTSAIKMITG